MGRQLLTLLALGLCVATAARADEATPGAGPQPTPAVAAIPVARIAEQTEHTDGIVRSLRARLAPDATITTIQEKLPPTVLQLTQLERDAARQLGTGLTPQALDDLERQWLQIKDQLATWNDIIGTRAQAMEEDAARLDELDRTWATTDGVAQQRGFPDALRDSIRSTRESLRDTQEALRTRRDALLSLLGGISSAQARVAEGFAQLDLAQEQMRRDLFTTDAPRLWKVLPTAADILQLRAAVKVGVARNWTLLAAFLRQQATEVVLTCVLLLGILAATVSLSRRRRPTDDLPPALEAVLSRPIPAALVLTLLLSVVVQRYAPVFVVSILGVLAIVPVLRLFRGPTAATMHRVLMLLGVLLFTSAVRRLLPAFAPLARLVLIVEAIGGIASILVIRQPARLSTLDLTDRWRRVVDIALWIVLGMFALSLAANLVGNVTLAILLTDGTLGAATAALAFLTASRILEALFIQLIALEPLQRLRSVAGHARALRRRAARIIHSGMLVLWCWVTLKLLGLHNAVLQTLSGALAARLTVGAVSLSLTDVLTVLVTLWVAFFIAGIVRIVLEEDALPRLSLPRGVPATISVAVNYIILLIGFVFALSAAGVDPGRVTLLAGALGVGIGFGLQNVVNNFVSGLILLFERPIQIGDIVTIGDVNGQVRRIGVRSSTIATFDGAEVVVPNALLVSERVTNWTLSNYQRRIEIKVGVAFGNDPTAVITLLEEAAKGSSDILDTPPPRALFNGFGESGLEFTLWVWTEQQDVLSTVRSGVAVAVHNALRAAAIEIPFPRRDVLLKTVESDAPASPPHDEGTER